MNTRVITGGNYRNPSASCTSALGNPLGRVKKLLIPTESRPSFASTPLISDIYHPPIRVFVCQEYFCVLWHVQMDGNSHSFFGLEIAQTQPQYGHKSVGEYIFIQIFELFILSHAFNCCWIELVINTWIIFWDVDPSPDCPQQGHQPGLGLSSASSTSWSTFGASLITGRWFLCHIILFFFFLGSSFTDSCLGCSPVLSHPRWIFHFKASSWHFMGLGCTEQNDEKE